VIDVYFDTIRILKEAADLRKEFVDGADMSGLEDPKTLII